MNDTIFDYIVVGSGCTGAMAAQTLVESGASVAMLDVGITNQAPLPLASATFLQSRRHDQEQGRYLIGENLEGIAWGKVGKGEQITPPRKYMLAQTEELLPVTSKTFSVVESLSYGGLGNGWGVGCWEWSPKELTKAGLDESKMYDAYQVVADRIGISATKDSAQKYTIRTLKRYDPSPHLDRLHSRLYMRYLRSENRLKRRGFVMGRAPLALITKPRPGRKKYAYSEMDYYSDADKSAYRPWITIDRLRKTRHFTYIPNQLVMKFKEMKDYVEVSAANTTSNLTTTYKARKLILAAGIFGTARIVLRSQGNSSDRLPLLCNPYSYVACVHPTMLGKDAEKRKLGFANLSLFLDEKEDNSDASMASLYGYQSLMLFRLARQLPMNFKDARKLLQYMAPALMIMGIHHPDAPTPEKYMRLVKDSSSPTGDTLQISYKLSRDETDEHERREKKYMSAMRSLGVLPLKKFDPGNGSSIHYAGTLPFSEKTERLTLDHSGKLHGAKWVYVADGSGFTHLPAKGLTFSLMANAHLVAKGALNE